MSPDRSPRKYPRTLRVNEVVREMIADELERLADPRLELVTITGVDVSPDLAARQRLLLGARPTDDPEIEERAAAARPDAPAGRLGS